MYILGIDAGGTKTRSLIVDEHGNECGIGFGGPANYHNEGLKNSILAVTQAASEALQHAKLKARDLTATCIGIASFDTPRDKKKLSREFKVRQQDYFGPNLTIVNDAVIGLYSGTTPPGLSLISGTGCNCYGIGTDGQEAFAGNWSYLLGDQGGGYHLSLRIFRSIMRAYDGRGEKTIFKDLVLKKLNLTDEMALVDWVYSSKPKAGEVASFGALLHEALNEGDAVAQKVLVEHIEQLTDNVRAVVKRTGLKDHSFDIVLIGSFFKTRGSVELLEQNLQSLCSKASLVFSKSPPVLGATIVARKSL